MKKPQKKAAQFPAMPVPEKAAWPMRINKYLALKNYATRRGADELVEKKRVIINGRIAVLGDKVAEKDIVEVKSGKKPTVYEYYAYHKPRGVVTLAPSEGEKSINTLVGRTDIFPVGRLDKMSTGLIIMTNDGRVTDRLLNPKYDHEKEYIVSTNNPLRSNFKALMEKGVDIGDAVTKKCTVEILGEQKFSIVLGEGKHHQIRRMADACFAEVRDLKRTRIMNIKLGTQPVGSLRPIKDKELKTFLTALGL